MKAVPFLRSIATRMRDDLLTVRAQSLTYTTLLSMVPLLAVMFSVLKGFGVHNEIEPLLVQALAPLGSEGAEIASQLVSFVDNMRVGVLGAVGVAGLFYTTISLIGQIEQALNAIFHVRRPRTVTEQFRDYIAIVVVGPVLVFSAFAMTASAESHWIVQRLMTVRGVGTAFLLVTRFLPLAFLSVAFAFLYKFLPRTPVRWGAAMTGGVIAAVLWQLAGVGFANFVSGSTKYMAIYSSFAILITFLIWLYLSWLIVLVGGEITYLLQYPSEVWASRAAPPVVSETAGLQLVIDIARRHLAGEPPEQSTAMAVSRGLPMELVENFVDALVAAGVLLRSAEPPGVALARPPALVTSGEILHALRSATPSADGAVALLLAERDRAVRDAMDRTTLEMLVQYETEGASQAGGPEAQAAGEQTPTQVTPSR